MDTATIVRSVIGSLESESNDFCEVVRWSDVEASERAAADAVLEVMKEDLHLPKSLRVCWFRSYAGSPLGLSKSNTFGTVPKTITGVFRPWDDPDVVWIRSGIGPRAAATAVIHEARHCWQLRFRSQLFEDALWREIDAARFCTTVVEQFSQA